MKVVTRTLRTDSSIDPLMRNNRMVSRPDVLEKQLRNDAALGAGHN